MRYRYLYRYRYHNAKHFVSSYMVDSQLYSIYEDRIDLWLNHILIYNHFTPHTCQNEMRTIENQCIYGQIQRSLLRLRVIVESDIIRLLYVLAVYNLPPHRIGKASFVELMALAKNFSTLTAFPPRASPFRERPLAPRNSPLSRLYSLVV